MIEPAAKSMPESFHTDYATGLTEAEAQARRVGGRALRGAE